MASITFAPKSGAEKNLETAVVVAEAPAAIVVSPQTRSIPSGDNITRDDLILPRINLVQKSGKLCDDFAPGTFIFEKQLILAPPGQEFSMVVLNTVKYFQEKVEYGSSEFGRRANSEEEVAAMGGCTTWGAVDKPYFQSAADLLVVIKAPEGISEEQREALFPFEHSAGSFAAAVYTVASSSYTSLAKRIFTDKLYTLKAGLHTGEYRVKSELKKNAANSWYVPVAGIAKKISDPELVEFYSELKNIL